MTTNPTRLGELTAYDLGSTITFHDGGATYTGTLISVKHEFPDQRRRTFLMLVSASGKWRHADRYPSNLSIDEVVRPVTVRGEAGPEKFVPSGPGSVVSIGGSVGGPITTIGPASSDPVGITPELRAELVAQARLDAESRNA